MNERTWFIFFLVKYEKCYECTEEHKIFVMWIDHKSPKMQSLCCQHWGEAAGDRSCLYVLCLYDNMNMYMFFFWQRLWLKALVVIIFSSCLSEAQLQFFLWWVAFNPHNIVDIPARAFNCSIFVTCLLCYKMYVVKFPLFFIDIHIKEINF